MVAGRVTPPVAERAPAGVITTVPGAALEATLPKFMSTVFEIAIGATIVADAVAVAVTCANEAALKPKRMIEMQKVFVRVFIKV
jgi:hypothetical protein